MSEPITLTQVLAKMVGDDRTDEEIAKSGARVTISQIDKLRNALKQAEQCCQHVIATGKPRHDDAKAWKRVAKAADKLLEGMA